MTKVLENRVAVVTGASRGIGKYAALGLARKGAHVVALARTQGGLEELDDEIKASGGTATLVPADIKDYPALDRQGAAIHERWGKLDILIGNAGTLGKLSPLGHIEPKTWDDVMAINVTANWRLIRSLDPLLKRSDDARAIFVTSGQAYKTTAYWGPYSTSKAALEGLVGTYAAENATTTVSVNLFSPGPTATRMRAQAMPGEDPETLPSAEAVAEQLVQMCLPDFKARGATYRYAPSGLFRFTRPAEA
jgi:NAD(P)-dependent dehydrogenase (short-subunit alcohol dehydrogenase family)